MGQSSKKNKAILSQNWSFRAKNWPKIAKKYKTKKKSVKSLIVKPKLGQKWQKKAKKKKKGKKNW